MSKKKFLLTFAIAILLAFFVGYGIEVFDDAPEYQDFCPDVYKYANETSCVDAGGEWYKPKEATEIPIPNKGGFCRNVMGCDNGYRDEQNNHDLVIFIVALLTGVGSIATGVVLKKDAISTGVVAGGVLLLLYGTMRYWRHANDVVKFVVLGIALAVLIWIGYKKFDQR